MLAGPSVQLRLHPQYPCPRLVEARARRVGVHRRPPGLAVRKLRTRCPPSPYERLSRSPWWGVTPTTTTRTPPRPTPSADDVPARLRIGDAPSGRCRSVPTFTIDRSAGAVPSFAPAASPRLRRRPSPWPHCRHSKSGPGVPRPADGVNRCAPHPGPYPPDLSRIILKSLSHAGSSRTPSRFACRTRPVW